jgi:hypothetical protein
MADPISTQVQLEKTYNAAADHYDHPCTFVLGSIRQAHGRTFTARSRYERPRRLLWYGRFCIAGGGTRRKRAAERGLANIEFRRAESSFFPLLIDPSTL